jgi:hypothetical protein
MRAAATTRDDHMVPFSELSPFGFSGRYLYVGLG